MIYGVGIAAVLVVVTVVTACELGDYNVSIMSLVRLSSCGGRKCCTMSGRGDCAPEI
jgi:hypothetical protein